MNNFKDKQKLNFERVKNLRTNPTNAEKLLLDRLICEKVRFIFQKGFIAQNAFVIVDFYFPKPSKLCVEIDGNYHLSPEQQKKDAWRTNYLESVRGFKVIRFTNDQINTDINTVIEKILSIL